jgi:hypothetical protein
MAVHGDELGTGEGTGVRGKGSSARSPNDNDDGTINAAMEAAFESLETTVKRLDA